MRPHPRADQLVVLTALAIFLLTLFTVPMDPCTVSNPCDPEPVTVLGVGLLLAVPVMTFVHRWAAAGAAAASAMVWLISDPVDDAGLGWRAWLPLVLVVVTVAVASLRWPAAADSAPVRQPPARPRLSVVTRYALAGATLVAAGTVGVGWTLWRQDRVAAQEAAASPVTAVVREHLDDGVIAVELPDGTQWDMEVFAAPDYPVGSEVQVLADDSGLWQLRSEPYDVTLLLVPFVVTAAAGVARLVRAGARHRRLRRLFGRPQPVRQVRVMPGGDQVLVLVPGPDRTAREFVIHLTDDIEGFDDGVDGDVDQLDDAAAHTAPATLYGTPTTGGWCAVQIGDRMYVPAGPVDKVHTVAYDPGRGLPDDMDDDGEPGVEHEDLLPQDRELSAPQDYHLTSPLGWVYAVSAGVAGGLGGIVAVLSVGDAAPPVLAVAAVVGSGLGYEAGWRWNLRPRLRWSTGGVAAVTPSRHHRVRWTDDSGLDLDEAGDIQVLSDQTMVKVRVRNGASRTRWQLVAALRHARRMALTDAVVGPPPELDVPRRPWQLYLAWALTCPPLVAVAWMI